MEPVNILDARNNLSRLIAQAIDGEDVVISNRGKPVVRLVPVAEPAPSSTGAALAKWFEQNPPTGLSLDALNERIREAREGWE
jgi:prevent-host-death family protein